MDAPASFETVGHLVHLNLREEQLPFKYLIGQVLLDKNPHVKTVVNKVGGWPWFATGRRVQLHGCSAQCAGRATGVCACGWLVVEAACWQGHRMPAVWHVAAQQAWG